LNGIARGRSRAKLDVSSFNKGDITLLPGQLLPE
jgi:hypothetical protein